MQELQVTIKRLTEWSEVKDSALVTIHKKSAGGSIKSSWKKDILLARHSPIRDLLFSIRIENVPRFVADQLVRHSQGVNWKMGTWRTDRGQRKRSEQSMDDLTDLKVNLNAEAILNISNKRLCVGCVTKETHEVWGKIIHGLGITEPELAKYCVPNCIHQGGCPEAFSNCGYFKKFLDNIPASKREEVMFDLSARYTAYQDFLSTDKITL